MAGQIWPEMAKVPFVKCFDRFLRHNFGSRYAIKSIKGSKDADHSLVSKKRLSKKMTHWVGAQGQVKLAKTAKTSPIMTLPRKTPNPKRKSFFNLN